MLLFSELQIDRRTIALQGLPDRLNGLKVVQLSDFHADGFLLTEAQLNATIVAANQAQADLILLTGDYVSRNPEPIAQLAPQLARLRSRYGTFACLGNHDLIYPHAKRDITAALTAVGIPVLWNEVTYPCGEGLALIGLADFWHRDFQPGPVLETVAPTIPRLVMSHNPDSAAVLQQWRVDLQLSGHTHGGQLVLPGIGNLAAIAARFGGQLPTNLQKRIPGLRSCLRVVKNWDWVQGYHRVGENQLYVNRGLGSYPPGRLFCPPEVTVITLTTAH
ncbi:MAG: hypothetical protein RLZZ511_3214 [Cyanobacteriota bacterium]|jgi:uncharacterized protein